MRSMQNCVLAVITGLLIAGFFGGCAETTPRVDLDTNGVEKVEGRIWYRERMRLPPNAEIYVALEDTARMDAEADVIASTRFTIDGRGGPPWYFSVNYDPGRLNDKDRYGLRVRVELDGRLLFINTEHVPAFDQKPGTLKKVMVSRTDKAQTGKKAAPPKPAAELVNTYWKLMELNSRPAKPGAGHKELHMILTLEENKVHGFSGCNQFAGTYKHADGQLSFGPAAATMIACVDGMKQEQAFLKALGKVQRHVITGDKLALYSSEEQLIMRFEAVYLP